MMPYETDQVNIGQMCKGIIIKKTNVKIQIKYSNNETVEYRIGQELLLMTTESFRQNTENFVGNGPIISGK